MKLGTYIVTTWLVGISTGVGIMSYKDNLALTMLSVGLGSVGVLVLGWLYITSQGS